MATNNTQNSWITQLIGAIMSIAILASSWFLNQAWTRIGNVEESVHIIELSTATNEGNRFTSIDWMNAKSIFDTKQSDLDRRVMRLEENSTAIKESLVEIKSILNKQRINQQ